jgi:hypothetical protein
MLMVLTNAMTIVTVMAPEFVFHMDNVLIVLTLLKSSQVFTTLHYAHLAMNHA